MKKWGGATAFVIAVFLFFAGSWAWFNAQQERVLLGLAKPDFPYGDYSQEELNTMYPQYVENNAPTIQSPEQTHQLFLTALKKGDFDEAVKCCFREGDRERMKNVLGGLNNSQLFEVISELDAEIKPDNINNWRSIYFYSVLRQGEKYKEYLTFIKSQNGIWYIESL